MYKEIRILNLYLNLFFVYIFFTLFNSVFTIVSLFILHVSSIPTIKCDLIKLNISNKRWQTGMKFPSHFGTQFVNKYYRCMLIKLHNSFDHTFIICHKKSRIITGSAFFAFRKVQKLNFNYLSFIGHHLCPHQFNFLIRKTRAQAIFNWT